jgi:uncharacterized protein (TIRG00374 family)
VSKSPTTKDELILLAKVAGTLLSIYMISISVSWDGVRQMLARLSIAWFILAVFVFWAAQLVSSLRCVYVARALGGDLDFPTSLRANFIGLWFTQVLPTSFGGDLIKIAILKSSIGLSIGTRTVLIDRFSGLVILLLVMSAQLPFYWIYFEQAYELAFMGLGSLGGLFVVIITSAAASVISTRFNLPFGIRHGFELMADLWRFRQGTLLAEQFWTSSVIHVHGILSFMLIGLAFGIHIEFIEYVLLVPVIFLLALIPFSFAGWGVREVGAIWVFSMVGMPKESALVISVGFGVLLLLAGIPGLLVWNLKR